MKDNRINKILSTLLRIARTKSIGLSTESDMELLKRQIWTELSKRQMSNKNIYP